MLIAKSTAVPSGEVLITKEDGHSLAARLQRLERSDCLPEMLRPPTTLRLPEMLRITLQAGVAMQAGLSVIFVVEQ